MLGLAAKYGLSDVREGLSVISDFFFFFRTDYMIPQTFTVTSSIRLFLLFSFSVLQFLVVVSVR